MTLLDFSDEEIRVLHWAVVSVKVPDFKDSQEQQDELRRTLGQLAKRLENRSMAIVEEAAERKDPRDPAVSEVVQHFESVMSVAMPRAQCQRRAAKTLIQRHSLSITKKGIEAAALCRGKKYAHQILSLEDLRDKWNNLVEYYRREGGAFKDAEAIRSMVRGHQS